MKKKKRNECSITDYIEQRKKERNKDFDGGLCITGSNDSYYATHHAEASVNDLYFHSRPQGYEKTKTCTKYLAKFSSNFSELWYVLRSCRFDGALAIFLARVVFKGVVFRHL